MKQVRGLLALMFAVALGLSVGWPPPPAAAEVDVYTTPGQHHVNGRDWRTICKPYSQTERCFTHIFATQVTRVNGVFEARKGWYFNNLTYKAAPRKLWEGNPLAQNTSWTATDGRQWRTECDTAVTGRNGCRSWVKADKIDAYQSGGVWRYRWVNTWVFNNMVRFSTGSPTAGVPATSIVDPRLRACVTAELGVSNTATLSATQLASVDELICTYKGVTTLRGLPTFPNLTGLGLDGNQLTTLEGMPALPKLKGLGLYSNRLTTLQHIPSLPGLIGLNLAENSVSSVAPLTGFTGLRQLDLTGNPVSDVHLLDHLVDGGLMIDD